ncbi:hypothetical protein AAG570_010137, partial [Ranatra chinensis]
FILVSVQSILKSSKTGCDKKALYIFQSPKLEQIMSMASTGKFLIAGTMGEINGWTWESVMSSSPKLSWTITIPKPRDRIGKTLVNSLLVREIDNISYIYAGCGDNRIHVFSLEDGKEIRVLDGHTDYIHSINSYEQNLVSASEDGSVRLWDLRQNSVTGIVNPHKNEMVARPHLGKWIGDVSLKDDWLVCGGGPHLSMWRMRSLELMDVFSEVQDTGIHVARFRCETVLAGGQSSHFYQLNYTGDVLAKLDTSSFTIYTAAYIDTPQEVYTIFIILVRIFTNGKCIG